jgi:hypothetical protein
MWKFSEDKPTGMSAVDFLIRTMADDPNGRVDPSVYKRYKAMKKPFVVIGRHFSARRSFKAFIVQDGAGVQEPIIVYYDNYLTIPRWVVH